MSLPEILPPQPEANLGLEFSDPESISGSEFSSSEFAGPELSAAELRPTPNLLDTLLFAILTACSFVVSMFFVGIAVHMLYKDAHALARSTVILISIPALALCYLIALPAVASVFRRLWHRDFLVGIHWNGATAQRLAPRIILGGMGLGIVVQIVSIHLPMPKTVPMDEIFASASGAWMATAFGVLLAPLFEELAFRGFLFPSLARFAGVPGAAILTCIAFAAMHSGQLAHAWAPLAVLFCVSMVLVLVRLRLNSLAASTLFHASYNAVLFSMMLVATGGYRHLERLKS